MTTTFDPPPGAMPTNGNGDIFVSPNTYAPRYASLDLDQLSSYSTNSPSQAKRALEAHLKDTDRRIQDASRLGTTLLQQRRDLAARLQEVEEVQEDDQVPEDLRNRLTELEKEYNEVGKESARAFLPKAKLGPAAADAPATPSALTGSGRESPTKMTAPSRRQRNQPSSRVHDIEFATEISTSLLAQVRQLQTALAEKDEELKDTTASKAQLEADAVGMVSRIKQLDDNEQRYKEENWNLETKLQDLESSHKDATEREQRVTQSLKATQSEKASAQRDLDDLKVSHEKLNDEHAAVKRQQETDFHGLRRDAATHEAEKSKLQKRIEELTSQNTELARAVSYRFNQPSGATDAEFVSADEENQRSDKSEDSGPESPIKGTPRHGMLESETLKSSLNHAHRMIQNLKNNIHREKTEKIELKRMLQDARDELESRRSENSGVGANVGKKRRSEQDNAKFRKPARPLGANRSSTTEVMEDEPDWEDHDGVSTPSKSRGMPGAYATSTTAEEADSTDAAFETATERGGTSDAFETGRESMDGNESDELTETEETNVTRSGTVRRAVSGLVGAKAGNRMSFQSTASASGDEDEMLQTPVQAQQPKYRVRVNRGSRRGDRVSEIRDSPGGYSPASSSGTPQPAGQSLGDELDALDEGSVEGTPSRFTDSAAATPDTQRQISVDRDTPGVDEEDHEPSIGYPVFSPGYSVASGGDEKTDLAKQANAAMLAHERSVNAPTYADAGVMTEPWEPEPAAQESSLRERAAEVVGGALAGFGLGRLGRSKQTDEEPEAVGGAAETDGEHVLNGDSADRPATALGTRDASEIAAPALEQSGIISQETEPVSPPRQIDTEESKRTTAIPVGAPAVVQQIEDVALGFSTVVSQDTEPLEPHQPLLPKRSSKRLSGPFASVDSSTQAEDYADRGIPGTDGARPGAGFFGVAEPKSRTVLGDVPPNAVSRDMSTSNQRDSSGLMPLVIKKEMSDEGSQTMVSGDDIDNMLRNKSRVPAVAVVDPNLTTSRPSTAAGTNGTRRSIDEANQARAPRRPASAGSMRNKTVVGDAPPLPVDHNQKIAAASKEKGVPSTAAVGTMGPPLMPASAYKQHRPRTPGESTRGMSRDGTTPRARQVQSPTGTGASRRTSISSFASEVDERLNGRTQFMYPDGVQPATDPRMIQAITQTMIGEYLWKYTRRNLTSETSNTRHRRFFWVHPYTRTLYWSEKDPSAAGRDMLKAKSVAIEAVRVISDDNAYPPGLHRKSLVVVTPGREIVFTAPTGQRHETWLNALSYLLLRTEQEKAEAEDEVNQDDINEFNPGFGSSIIRSISRMTGRSQSRVSLSSYNSRTTRNSSPQRGGQRQSTTTSRTSKPPPSPTVNNTETTTSRYSTARDSNAGRLSSVTSKFGQRGSYSTARGRGSSMSNRGRPAGSEIYDASVAADSAEDLRAVMEKQEQDADRLENVRACCDGKHDVGSLSRTTRHSSLGHKFVAHSHAHPPPPRTDPIRELP